MSCGSQLPAPTATPVDFRTITGSYAGDHRKPAKDGATGAIAEIANAGGPRDAAKQFQNSRNDKGAPFQSTVNPTEVGD